MSPEGSPGGGLQAQGLVRRLRAGDRLALARALSLVESAPWPARDGEGGDPPGDLGQVLAGPVRAHVVGVTGAPGSGKSTLIGRLALHLRGEGRRVGVLAVDPSSPFSGGALLGDRLRMTLPSDDPGLFVRSVASRGQPGGLAPAIFRMVRVLDAAGMDVVVVETVGAGQNDVGVLGVADTVVLVFNPSAGDEIQALKAGIVEIGDVMVVNKADLPAADDAYRALTAVLQFVPGDGGWRPPVVLVSSVRGTGFDELAAALERHRRFLQQGPAGARRRRLQAEWELRAALAAAVERRFVAPLVASGRWETLVDRVARGDVGADRAAGEILEAGAPRDPPAPVTP